MRPSLRVYLKVLKERGVKSFDILKKKSEEEEIEGYFLYCMDDYFFIKKIKTLKNF